MKTYIAVAITLATAVLAQNSTVGIPSNASSSCQTFLRALNADSQIQTCLNGIIDATSEFDPTATTATTIDTVAINQALQQICTSNFESTCNRQRIRQSLADFYTECQVDLLGAEGQSANRDVIDIYDVLYLITPLREAICAKDAKGYCINQLPGVAGGVSSASSASTSSESAVATSSPPAKRHDSLHKRQDVDGQETLGTFSPNSTVYNAEGVPYLFLTADTPPERLCQACTAKIVGAYVAFENSTPYALGLANSPILSGQIALWREIKKCGGSVVAEILQAVNSDTPTSGALTRFNSAPVAFALTGTIFASLATLVI